MPRWKADRTAWIVILAVAFAARLAAGAWWERSLGAERRFFFGDSEGYWQLAGSLARGEPYAYPDPDSRAFRMPGYPLLLAALWRAYGGEPPVMAARALSAVLGTVAVAVCGWWTRQLFDARAGRIAACIAALYPGGVALGALVLSEAPFCPLMLGQLALWGRAWQASTFRSATGWAGGGGVLAATAIYMRPSWLLFTPFAIVCGTLLAGSQRRHWTIAAVMCATIVAGLFPWWMRNLRMTGHFVPTTLQVGASLYDGLNPRATGASDMRFVAEAAAAERAAPGDDDFEYRLDRRLAREASAWAWAHPRRAARLAFVKIARLWNVWPNEPAFRAWGVRLAMLATYVPLVLLGLVGAWRFRGAGWPYQLAWLPAVYLTLLHVVFVSSIRYREPAMLALAALAAGVLAGAAPAALGTTTARHPAHETA